MRWALLGGMSSDDQRTVLALCRRRRFDRGETVFHEGDPGESLHLLQRGTVAVRVTTPLGDVATLEVFRPGDTFGEQALIAGDSTRSATVVALEKAETLQLAKDDFEALLAEHPGVSSMLAKMLDTRLRATTKALVEALYLPVPVRVFRRLVALADIYGEDAIPITQEDLATMAGTARQTLNKLLRQAQSDGLIELHRGQIAVSDRAGLERRAR